MYLGEPLIQQDPMGLKRVLSPDHQGTVPDGPLLVHFFRRLNSADRYMTDGCTMALHKGVTKWIWESLADEITDTITCP